MSVEQMMKAALGDPEAAAEAARKSVEKANARVMAQMKQLQELVDKLESEEDEDELECLEEEAQDIAEALEIEFVYTRADGTKRVYSPEAFWEASGGCSWAESAQWGYDYGWMTNGKYD